MKAKTAGFKILSLTVAIIMTVAMLVSCNSNFGEILSAMLGMTSQQTSSEDSTDFTQTDPSDLSSSIPSDASELESDMSSQVDISDPTVALQGLTFKYETAFMELGNITRLRYTPSPINADTSDLKWVSSAPEIISVSNKGKITANAGGKATITAYSETYEVKGQCLIYVRGEAEEEDTYIKGEEGESDFFTPPTEENNPPTPPPVSSDEPSSVAPPVSSDEPSSVAPPVSSDEPSSVAPPVSSDEPSSVAPPVSSDEPSSVAPPVSSSETSSGISTPVLPGTTVDSREDDAIYKFDNKELLTSLIRVKQPDGGFVVATVLDFVVFHTGSELDKSYTDEAIRAQAVAVYTYYIMYNMSAGASYATSEHRRLPIDSETGKVLFDTIYDQFPRPDGSFLRLIELCSSVLGQTVRYDGKAICAAFSAGNRGASQCNSPYWGSKVYPYLTRVASPWDRQNPEYESVKVKTRAEVESLLKSINSSIILDADPSLWFDEIERDIPDEGYVLYVTIGDISIKGTSVRTKFKLRSNCFFVKYDSITESFTFTCHGYGHGIGMSQWGADGMAKEGYSYVTILRHYYQGTTVDYEEPRFLYEGSVSDNVSSEETSSEETSSEDASSEDASSETAFEENTSSSVTPSDVTTSESSSENRTESVPPDESEQSAPLPSQ